MFAEIAAPLHALTMKNKKFDWTTQCDHAFNKLKNALISAPILAMPNDTDPFLLDPDACDVSIGAVLSQVQGGVERVIAYALRSLSKPERNYCVTRKELLAIVCYTKAFRQYLLGRQFVVRTDHSALQWLRSTPEPIGQQARWCETLEEFDFQIIHRPGQLYGNADALLRKPCRQCGNNGANLSTVVICAVTFATVENGDRWSKNMIAAATAKDQELSLFAGWLKESLLPLNCDELTPYDPITKSLHAYWERFNLKEGVIYRRYWEGREENDTWQILAPVEYREEIMRTAHASMTGGHMGVNKMQTKVAKRAYWVGWTRDVRDFCRRCDVCAKYHRGTVRKQGELQNMCVGAPWEKVPIDVTGPHSQSSMGNKFMVTMLDHFTKYAFAFPIRAHDAVTVPKHLVERVFLVYRVPLQLLSDRGAEFEGSLMTEICRLLEIDKIRTTSFKPSTNDALERVHRTLNTMLGKIVNENTHVAYILAAYNATEHSATGYLPNMLVYGRELRFPNELLYTDVEDHDVAAVSSVEFVVERQALFKKSFALARETLGCVAERCKKRYDMCVKPEVYKIGDWVYYFCPQHRVGRSPKWQRFYSGPFLVTEKLGPVNLRIQRSPRANPMVVYVDRIKHCMRTTPTSSLGTDNYQIIPIALEPDVLPIMFGGVDRSSPGDIAPNAVARPKRSTAIPARFLSRIYAVPINVYIPHDIYRQRCDCVNNPVMCLCFISDMKKAGYVCFPCWNEDGRDRPYSRSYDLIAHMVNVHGKYTENAVNNVAYRTDGSDVRDATAEEKLRYLDANKHKHKKAVGTVSSGELSKIDTAENTDASSKSRPVSARGEQSERDASACDKGKSGISKKKCRESSRKNEDKENVRRSSDRESSQKKYSCEASMKTTQDNG